MGFDIDSEKVTSNVMTHADEVDVDPLVDDLETLSEADIEGMNKLPRKMGTADAGGIRGHAFEAKVASGSIRNPDRTVYRLGQKVKSSIGGTEIDIEFNGGSTVEVKSGSLSGEDAIKQLRKQLTYRSEHSLGGTHYIAAGGEIGDDVRNFMNKNNIEVFPEDEYKGNS